jgi:glycosyltransferase involved in cell wall biosynthesis
LPGRTTQIGRTGSTTTVSVVVTAYNHERFIADTIRSLLSQSYPPCEVIVVNDGSTDGTAAAVRAFGDRVRLVDQANAGVAGARNAGVRAATGELVAFIDGDDVWDENKLELQVEAFRQFPEAGLIVADVDHFSDTEVLWSGPLHMKFFATGEPRFRLLQAYDRLVAGNFINTTSQVMAPRRVLEEIGLSDARFPLASDYDLYLRIAERHPIVLVDRVLAHWRYVRTSASGPMHSRRFRWDADMFDVLRKHQRSSDTGRRRLIASALRRRVADTSRFAYYHGADGQRRWATSYLAGLAVRYRSASAAAYLVALWSPAFVRRLATAVVQPPSPQETA